MSTEIKTLKTKIDYLAIQDPNVINDKLRQIVGPDQIINTQTIIAHLDEIYSQLKPLTGPFPNPFKEAEYGSVEVGEAKSRLEKLLMNVSSCIRLKPDWLTKINNPIIVNKWKLESLNRGVNEEEFKYVIDELHHFATLSLGKIRISPVDGVWEADHEIDATTKTQLLECVKQFEDLPESELDWHPGSNQQVLDLVHPSLYCFVNDLTHVTEDFIPLSETLTSMGSGSPYTVPEEKSSNISNHLNLYKNVDHDYSLSKKYQWLPSEFKVDNDGHVTIESYINNLHPIKHKKLYGVIEKIFESFVPMFNKVLTDLANGTYKKNKVDVDSDWYESFEEYMKRCDIEKKDEDDEDDPYEDEYDSYRENKIIKIPEIKPFVPSQTSRFVDLNGRTLQVIVKLANIELKPENPRYPGGSWHVEGMKNEKIVASGIYYYCSDNITESHLEFREAINDPDYEQNDNRGVEEIYGLIDTDPLNQDLGYLITQEDRCIAFPNLYQHRVKPFELIDGSKPGHRKILVFFLVDPTHRIISTANVPPQQLTWYEGKEIPQSLMTLEEAKKHREELMKERKYFIKENTERFFERPFSLCEH